MHNIFQKINKSFLEKCNPYLDAEVMISSLSSAFESVVKHPEKREKVQKDFENTCKVLMQHFMNQLSGKEVSEDPFSPNPKDRRFQSDLWGALYFDIMKQSYLGFSKWFENTMKEGGEYKECAEQKQIEFFTRQIIDFLSPSNFPHLNPEVVQESLKTGGVSLMKGIAAMADDMHKGLDPSITDMDHFKLGENIATTPGSVIFENDLIQLIQYDPSTDKVFKKPLLIIPPWINKYYVFDLTEENSMVRWLRDQGHTVFIISWVNPNETHRTKRFEDYAIDGALAAIDVVKSISEEKSVNTIGYCLGGTLLSCLAAYLAEKKRNDIASITLLATLTDFHDAGDLTTFMTENYIQKIEQKMEGKGYLSGQEMAKTFNMLRSNDLYWSHFINNYLMGRDPIPFDFLYWSSDNTAIPEALHKNLLRNFYKENLLIHPGKFKIFDVGIDLSKITVPIYMISAFDDHITPWDSTYNGTKLFPKENLTFVLGGAGHVAGIINHPNKNKYCHKTNSNLIHNAQEWEKNAKKNEGTWWLHWAQWVGEIDATKVLQKKVGNAYFKPIEKAPGKYARKKCE